MRRSVVTAGDFVTVRFEEAESLCQAVLQVAGAPASSAEVQTKQLIAADLCGRPSHGLQRLPTLVERIHNRVLEPAAEPVIRMDGVVLDVDGRRGFGPVALWKAVEAAIPVARTSGLALAVI